MTRNRIAFAVFALGSIASTVWAIGGALWLPVQSFFTAGFLSLLIKGPAEAGHYD